MSAFTAAIIATKPRTNDIEHSLNAYALLFEGERPVWKIYMEGKEAYFICQLDNILEQGVVQLNTHYCQHNDQSTNNINPDIQFTLITWPGVGMPNKDDQIAKLKKEGVNIVERVGIVIKNEEDQKLKKMTEFVNTLNRLVD